MAWNWIAELGADLSVFPDASHCASWVGLVPGEDESAGKTRSKRCRKGNRYLRTALVQAAGAASRCKKGYLRAFFHRVKQKTEWSRAAMAVAHKILTIAYTMLKTGRPYQERGEDYFARINPERTAGRLVKRLEALGLEVRISLPPRVELNLGESGD